MKGTEKQVKYAMDIISTTVSKIEEASETFRKRNTIIINGQPHMDKMTEIKLAKYQEAKELISDPNCFESAADVIELHKEYSNGLFDYVEDWVIDEVQSALEQK